MGEEKESIYKEEIEKSQAKIHKSEANMSNLKALNLMTNFSKIAPNPPGSTDSNNNDVAIIEALKSDDQLMRIEAEINGYYFTVDNKLKQGDPLMNEIGILNFMRMLRSIAALNEFSNIDKDKVDSLISFDFKTNLPHITIRYEDYNLNKRDFGVIGNYLYQVIKSTYYKARGAGHRNVVRGTFSEDVAMKALGGDLKDANKKGGVKEFIKNL